MIDHPFLLPGLCVIGLSLACLHLLHRLQTAGIDRPPRAEFCVGFLAAGTFAGCFVPVPVGFLSAILFLFAALPASLFFLLRILYRGLSTGFHVGAAVLLGGIVALPFVAVLCALYVHHAS